MSNKLLTRVVIDLVNKKAKTDAYGVSLICIPDFDYNAFVHGIKSIKNIELFFLGFAGGSILNMQELPEGIKCSFNVEDAEASRNTGDESVFRVLIVKRVGIEKLSSLRWFPEITLEQVYKHSCDLVKKELAQSNTVIESLLSALKGKQIRSILSFERVLDYLQIITEAKPVQLPEVVCKNIYKLGLLSDKDIMDNKPGKDEFVSRIKHNHEVLERISNLEQTERQSITHYNARQDANREISRLILAYYRTKDIELLQQMELSEAEKCLKAAKEKKKPPVVTKKQTIHPTALAAQLVFDDNPQKINEVLSSIEEKVDGRTNATKKSDRIEVEVNDTKLQIKTEPITETIAEDLIEDDSFGGIIRAEVQSPETAIMAIEKYGFERINRKYLGRVLEKLERMAAMLTESEQISNRIYNFLAARDKIVPFRKRLQDAPMLQVMAQYSLFADYINCYEKLLNAINDDFPKVWALASSTAKDIINAIISLDYVYIVGKRSMHALPTPLHPLYLWKYVELAREILDSKGVSSLEENNLSESDKAFIIRKADDIPDPLSIMLLPESITERSSEFLPLSGRLGTLPVYSNVAQINQSESGMDTLKQAIIRYLCLYPHANMMLRLALIDPPSVETVVSMLKALNSDREFNVSGIDVSIYRTKEVPSSWIEISDAAQNEGLLGRFKGKRSMSFNLKITNQAKNYRDIIERIDCTQHLIVVFDPNEIHVDIAQNNKQLHINPLCVPKVYSYNPIEEEVEIRPANEGSIFSVYSSILEKLKDQPSTFRHTSSFFRTPLKRETYDSFLKKGDWLVILDQSLKCWDISLRAASEKLFYKENDYRSVGIYSGNCNKFILGYDSLVKGLGNLIPQDDGLKNIIESVREINDDGLLSIVSHKSNQIFDENHGKGSLGTAIVAIRFKNKSPGTLLVGMDTQLAREWLSDRESGMLPDLVGIRFEDEKNAIIDLIEVKTYSDALKINEEDQTIEGHAVEQVSILESLIREMCGSTERITTVSRREILRQQVFECLFQSNVAPLEKRELSERLNDLFAGQYSITVKKHIAIVEFEEPESKSGAYKGIDEFANQTYELLTIGSKEIQSILSNIPFDDSTEKTNDQRTEENTSDVNANAETQIPNKTITSQQIEQQKKTNNDPKTDSSSTVAESEALSEENQKRLEEKCSRLNSVFKAYGIKAYPVSPENVLEAARFTRFQVQLRTGEVETSITKRIRDIERELEAEGEILVDHIKGTKYLAVDVPFSGDSKPIKLLDHLKLLDESNMRLPFIAGQLPDGHFDITDLAAAPHMLIAGTTGSGKTIFLYSIIVSLLHKYSSDEVSLLIIDPKMTDFVFFENLPHLYCGKVVTNAEEALDMLKRINEQDKEERTEALKACRSRDIESYNEKNPNNKMKRLVVIIDEYSDLIQAAQLKEMRKEFENNLLQLLQRVRNLGIHLIIATQRPSAQIVTGALKAVIPFRVSFRLPSHTDSQTILDMPGAENLLGKGDMLMVTESDTKRMQGLFITEDELETYLNSKQE